MKTRLALTLLGLVLPGIVVFAPVPVEPLKNSFAGEEWKLPAAVPALKPAAGVEAVNLSCALCHSMDYITTQPPLTRAQWTAGVEKMKTRFGAPLATNQIPPLVEYLTVNYGRK